MGFPDDEGMVHQDFGYDLCSIEVDVFCPCGVFGYQ
jgi:hypothetical protein